MTYETTAGWNKIPFLLSSLPVFLRGSEAMVVEAILFDCGYAALGMEKKTNEESRYTQILSPKVFAPPR